MQAADITAAANSRLAFHPRLCHPQDNQKRTIDVIAIPRRPALTMSAGVDRSVFFLLP
jgi:hypothetical protein